MRGNAYAKKGLGEGQANSKSARTDRWIHSETIHHVEHGRHATDLANASDHACRPSIGSTATSTSPAAASAPPPAELADADENDRLLTLPRPEYNVHKERSKDSINRRWTGTQ